jgi:hypothetical protein
LTLRLRGLKEGKKTPRESSLTVPRDSDLLERWRVWQKRREPVKPIRRKRRLQIQVPETQSAFHPNAQRNAFRRRDVRQQSRSFARWDQWLRPSPNSNRLAEMIGDDFPVFHAARILSVLHSTGQRQNDIQRAQ